jgi:prepilin-type N-terminal cleavage/methylation domain-containing protein
MDQTAILKNRNNKGVTLIEMMFALVILLIMSLAVMQTALLGIATNVQNTLRDEAVSIAEMRINQLTSLPFTATLTDPSLVAPGTTPAEAVVTRSFRGFSVQYTPTRTITDISASSKQITITVTWDYKGKSYTHGVTTIMRRQ